MYDVYDFDGTIYDGDSSIDFFLYALKKNKKLWKYLPKILYVTVLYILKMVSTKKYKEVVFAFIKDIPNIDAFVLEFWKEHNQKINDFFLNNIKEKKKICVISASPEFLLKPYLDKWNIPLIGTKMDKEGKIKGENCNKEEKVKRMNKWNKKAKIDKFYSDSSKDTPLAKLSKEAYIVNHGKLLPWDDKYFTKKKDKEVAYIIFFLFLFIYIFLGIFLTYHYDFSKNFDLLFNADTSRIIDDMSKIFGNHYRIKVHPLYVIMVQPIILFLTGITADKILSCIIFSALTSSLTVTLFYKLSTLFIEKRKISILITLLFGCTFTNFVFAASLEVYNLAGLFLLLLWYQTIKMFKEEKITKLDYLYYILLGIASIGVTVTNFVVFLITSFFLWIGKKVKIKKIIIIQIVVIALTFLLSILQNYTWHNTPTMHSGYKANYGEETSYMSFNIGLTEIKKVIKDDYIHSIVASNIVSTHTKSGNKMAYFDKIGIEAWIISTALYLLIIYYVIKNFSKNKYINAGLLLTLLFNSAMHAFYGNETPFLYSCHFTYLFFLLFALNYEENKKTKWIDIALISILTFTFLINSIRFIKLVRIVGEVLPHSYYRTNFSTIILACIVTFFIIVDITLCILFYWFLKKLVTKEEKIKYGLGCLGTLILIELSFIAIHTTPQYAKIGNKELNIPKVIIEENR